MWKVGALMNPTLPPGDVLFVKPGTDVSRARAELQAAGWTTTVADAPVGPFDVVVAADPAVLAAAARARPAAARVLLYTGAADVSSATALAASPIDPVALASAIDRALGRQGVYRSERVEALIGGADRLPVLPSSALELMRLLDRPNVTNVELLRVIERDPAMTAKTLQLANSAWFGLPRQVGSLTQAITWIGLNALRALAITGRVFDAIPGVAESRLEAKRRAGLVTAQIAREVGGPNQPDAFTAAMLRDIGELLWVSRRPDEVGVAEMRARTEKRPIAVVEEDVFGLTHAQVGGHLLAAWKLPPGIVRGVACSRTPPHPTWLADPSGVTYVACALADEVLGVPGAGLPEAWVAASGLGEAVARWRQTAAKAVSRAAA